MIETGFIKAYGIDYKGTLPKIKKSDNKLQPIFEALTNSFESLKIKGEESKDQEILIRCYFQKNLFTEKDHKYDYQGIQIEDNGIGFNDKEFERAISLNDNRKGFQNKGTGRVQYLHFFDKTRVTSIYKDPNVLTGFNKRVIEFSKRKPFLDENAIINHISTTEIEAKSTKTIVTFIDLLHEKDKTFYNDLEISFLKSEIINHFLVYLCDTKKSLPRITIEEWKDNKLSNEVTITSSDLPELNHETNLSIPYREISQDGKEILKSLDAYERFNLKAFIINSDHLVKNELLLTSKGQRAREIKLLGLSPSDKINDKRYLFLLSGDYLDLKDSDTRGEINIPKLEDFKKHSSELFENKSIIIEDIESETNKVIGDYYTEIKKKNNDKKQNLEKLKQMFLLDEQALKTLNIGLNDSDDQILKKVYESEIKQIAKRDAEIKYQIEHIENLNTNSDSYQKDLRETIDELVKTIPLQNKNALTHYVARRKLVLDLFGKILNKETEKLKKGGKIDESIMHNLIFQQSSKKPNESDLWIVNEEFIYFRGYSEFLLKSIEIKGKKLFKKKFEEEEERYLNSSGKKRLDKRPDILLFPEDGKCIIIELKAPHVDVSDHLNQINKYASLIRNYTNDEFEITRFYGYLIGENIEPNDVLGAVSTFEESPNFKYLYQPAQKVIDFKKVLNGQFTLK